MPFFYYIVSFFVSFYRLFSKVYVFWYKYSYLSFLLTSICMVSIYPSTHFTSVGVFESELNLLQAAYRLFFKIHSVTLCLLIGAFNQFTFKVIIYRYVFSFCDLFRGCFCSFSLTIVCWLSLVIYLDFFFFTIRFIYNIYICIEESVWSWWLLKFDLIIYPEENIFVEKNCKV